jgi:hypothetical protein
VRRASQRGRPKLTRAPSRVSEELDRATEPASRQRADRRPQRTRKTARYRRARASRTRASRRRGPGSSSRASLRGSRDGSETARPPGWRHRSAGLRTPQHLVTLRRSATSSAVGSVRGSSAARAVADPFSVLIAQSDPRAPSSSSPTLGSFRLLSEEKRPRRPDWLPITAMQGFTPRLHPRLCREIGTTLEPRARRRRGSSTRKPSLRGAF